MTRASTSLKVLSTENIIVDDLIRGVFITPLYVFKTIVCFSVHTYLCLLCLYIRMSETEHFFGGNLGIFTTKLQLELKIIIFNYLRLQGLMMISIS